MTTTKALKRSFPWAAILILTLIYTINFVDRQIIAVLGTELQQAFSLSNTQLGLLYGTVFSFFYAFAGIPMGHLADRFSRKWMIVGGVIIWSTATVLSGFASSFLALIVYRIVVALAESACSPAAYSLITDMVPAEQRAGAISLYASGIFIGVGMSFLLGGSVSQAYGWREALFVVGIPGIIVGLIAAFVIKNIPHSKSEHELNSGANGSKTQFSFTEAMKWMLSQPAIRYHLIGFALLAMSGYSLLGFLSQVFAVQHGEPALIAHYGWFMFGTGGMVALSGLLADRLARKHPRYRFVMGIIAAVGGLPLYVLGLQSESALTALILIGSGALIASSYNGVAAALIQDMVPRSIRALAGAVYLFIISVAGFGTGPLLTGYLMDTIFVSSGRYAAADALMLVLSVAGVLGGATLYLAMHRYDAVSSRLKKS